MQDKEKYSIEMKDLYNRHWIKSLAKEVMPSGTFSPDEYKYFHKWIYQMKLPQDFIEFAVEYSAFVQGRCRIAYFDKLIYAWKSSGITTKEEAMKNAMKSQPAPRAAEKGPEPVDFDSIHIIDRRSIAAVTCCADGKPVIYVQGISKEFVVEDATYEEAIARIEGRRIKEDFTAEDGAEEPDDLQPYDRIKRAYDMLHDAQWRDREITDGTPGQKKFAEDIRSRARRYAMSICQSFLGMKPDALENAVIASGLNADSAVAIAKHVNDFFSDTEDFQQIINAKDEMAYEGLVSYGLKWMEDN